MAYLIREFTDLFVVGLKYKGHINIAVAYKWDLPYSKLTHNSEAYAVCDPSLENSEVGENMHDQEAIIEVMKVE